jgi:acetoacetyl-CoA reductase/3-oxoacyl-[acyl-carrier protein] reductase
MFDAGLKGRLAVVTGGGRGIGLAIARCLLDAGAEVHVFESDMQEPRPFPVHAVDVRRNEQINAALATMSGPVSLLINNAGITRDRTLQKMSDAEWQDVLDVNLTGSFNMIRAVTPGMIGGGFGRIVNVTSINGLRGKFGQANYSASKAGLIGLTKSAARELGPKGITVNAVAPGMVLTEMVLSVPEEMRARALAESLLQKLVEPIDVAQAVLFLLSDSARMITGTVLRVDAGQCT